VLCCVVLRCVALCCVALRCVVLCCVALCCVRGFLLHVAHYLYAQSLNEKPRSSSRRLFYCCS
jgi:hypothetical protein